MLPCPEIWEVHATPLGLLVFQAVLLWHGVIGAVFAPYSHLPRRRSQTFGRHDSFSLGTGLVPRGGSRRVVAPASPVCGEAEIRVGLGAGWVVVCCCVWYLVLMQ